MLHGDKDPQIGVPDALVEACPYACVVPRLDGVDGDARVSQLPLLWCQPPCLEWFVREDEDGDDGEDEGRDPLDDEQPAPSGEAGDTA